MTIRYESTRGSAPILNFEEVLLAGLAADGGLYLPTYLPQFSVNHLRKMREMNYTDLAFEIIAPFVGDSIPSYDLHGLIAASYSEFRDAEIAPLVTLEKNHHVLELFHGPTLAFKDFALQLLGRLLDYVLKRRGEKAVIMGATSGDTGSAAIEGCRTSEHLDVFILHPYKLVSEVQRRQMTTTVGPRIHNLAIKGNFDDCQKMVKQSFTNKPFLPDSRRLVAVNSINWARIMAQIVYYFSAALRINGVSEPVSFSVPTGNFGDIYAGFLASRMGLLVDKLIIATNRNDVLHRALTDGIYRKLVIEASLSPSMDITVSSNFERLLFDVSGRDGKAVAAWMRSFDRNELPIPKNALALIRDDFSSVSSSDDDIADEISSVWADYKYLVDPHTATGTRAARLCNLGSNTPIVTLATAHPAKFPKALEVAAVRTHVELPAHLSDLHEREEVFSVLPNDLRVVQNVMAGNCNA